MTRARELLRDAPYFASTETQDGFTDTATVPLQIAVQRAAQELLEGATVKQRGESTVLRREECCTVITPADAGGCVPEDADRPVGEDGASAPRSPADLFRAAPATTAPRRQTPEDPSATDTAQDSGVTPQSPAAPQEGRQRDVPWAP